MLKNLLAAHRGEDEADRGGGRGHLSSPALCNALWPLDGGNVAVVRRRLRQPFAAKPAGATGFEAFRGSPATTPRGRASSRSCPGIGGFDTGCRHDRIGSAGLPPRDHHRGRRRNRARGVIDFGRTARLRMDRRAWPAGRRWKRLYGILHDLIQVADEAYGFFEPLPEPAGCRQVAALRPVCTGRGAGGSPRVLHRPARPAAPVCPRCFPSPAGGCPTVPDPGCQRRRRLRQLAFSILPRSLAVVEAAPRHWMPAAALAAAVARKAPARRRERGQRPIRVSVEGRPMINLVGELVITQAMLTQAASNVDPVVFERLINGLANWSATPATCRSP